MLMRCCTEEHRCFLIFKINMLLYTMVQDTIPRQSSQKEPKSPKTAKKWQKWPLCGPCSELLPVYFIIIQLGELLNTSKATICMTYTFSKKNIYQAGTLQKTCIIQGYVFSFL